MDEVIQNSLRNSSSLAHKVRMFDVSEEHQILQLLNYVRRGPFNVKERNNLRDVILDFFASDKDIRVLSPALPILEEKGIQLHNKGFSFNGEIIKINKTPLNKKQNKFTEETKNKIVVSAYGRTRLTPTFKFNPISDQQKTISNEMISEEINDVKKKKLDSEKVLQNVITNDSISKESKILPDLPVSTLTKKTLPTNTPLKKFEELEKKKNRPTELKQKTPLDRIKEIKKFVNDRVGNPINLLDIDNTIGREYMNALLSAMKQINGGSHEDLLLAMERLEKAYKSVGNSIFSDEKVSNNSSKNVDLEQGDTTAVLTSEEEISSSIANEKQLPTEFNSTVEVVSSPKAEVTKTKISSEKTKSKFIPTENTSIQSDVSRPEVSKSIIKDKIDDVQSEVSESIKTTKPEIVQPEVSQPEIQPEISKPEVKEKIENIRPVVTESINTPKSAITQPKITQPEIQPKVPKPILEKKTEDIQPEVTKSIETVKPETIQPGVPQYIAQDPVKNNIITSSVQQNEKPQSLAEKILSENEKRDNLLKTKASELHKQTPVDKSEDILNTPEITAGLSQLLSEWKLFKSSGIFGTGPGGIDHPLYKTLSPLFMSTVISGRFEGATTEIRRRIDDYMKGWYYEQNVVYEMGETFEHYLRRVISEILSKK